jgi:hypothetical protein
MKLLRDGHFDRLGNVRFAQHVYEALAIKQDEAIDSDNR